MANLSTPGSVSDHLLELVGCIERHEGFDQVVAALSSGREAALEGVWGSSCALVAAALARHSPGPVVVVCPRIEQVDRFIDDLGLFLRTTPERFPARESLGKERVLLDEVFGDRVRVLKLLESQRGESDAGDSAVTLPRDKLVPVPQTGELPAPPTAIRLPDRLRCVTEPDAAQKVLLGRLGLALPRRLRRVEEPAQAASPANQM